MNENSVPSPAELKNQFIIPWNLADMMSPWLGLSTSMSYQILRQGRKPSIRTKNKLRERLGIPTEIWNKNIDELAEYLYIMWYESTQERDQQATGEQLRKLQELF